MHPSTLFAASARVAAVIFFWSLAASCEKVVDIKLEAAGQALVVEGGIETGLPPVVQLTNSLSFFSRVDLAALENSFVHGAIVHVSDGTKTVRLKEYVIDSGGIKASYYSIIDFQNPVLPSPDSLLLGEVGKTYALTIEYGGKMYTASTVIPSATVLDSLWYQKPARQPDSLPEAREVYFRYRDPDTLNNCVRYFTSVNGGGFYPGAFNSVFIDEIINGGVISSRLFAGYNRSGRPPGDSTSWFFKGDTVELRWAAIDRATYDFWNSFEFALNAVGNPFASPTRLATNIRGGGLGVWAGYGTQYHTLIIKD